MPSGATLGVLVLRTVETCGKLLNILINNLLCMTHDLNLHDGDVASTPAEKASALNAFLQLVLVLTSLFRHWPVRNYIPHLHPLDCPIELLCSEEEVFEILSVTLIRQRFVGLTAPQVWCLNVLLPVLAYPHEAFIRHLIQCHIIL